VANGSLTLAGGDGGTSGTFSVESTGTLTFASGTFSLGNGITNSGTVILSSATVTVAGGYGGVGATDIQSGRLTLEGESSGAFTVESLGTLVLLGTSFSLDPTSSVSGSGTVQMTRADFTFAGIYSFGGTTIVSNGDLTLEGGDGGTSGAFTVQAASTLDFAGEVYAPAFLTATSSTSQVVVDAEAAVTAGGISLASGALVEIRGGMLTLDGTGGSSSGDLSVDSGGTLDFAAGNYVFDSASSITGGGTVEVSLATLTVGGVYSIAGTTDIQSGALRLNGGDGGDTSGAFTVEGGTLLFGGGSFSLDSGSTLSGAGNVTVTCGASVIVTGTYGITGLTDVQSGTLALDGGDGNSVSSGNYTVEAPGSLIFGGGTFALNSSSITGAGNVELTGGVSVSIAQTYSVTGLTDVSNDSTLSLQGGDGGSSGSFTVDSGSALDFGDGTFTFGTSAGISGAGNVTIDGATVSFEGSYSVGGATEIDSGSACCNTGAGVTLASLTLTGGTLTGSDTLTVTGPTAWDGGTMAGTGVTDAKGGLEIQQGEGNDPLTLDARTLINEGTATVDGSSTNLSLEDGAAIENDASGTRSFTDDNALSLGANATGSETFTNYGILEKSGGLGVNTLGTDLVNSGTVDVQKGTLSLQGSTTTSSGAFISEAGATLDFGAGGFTLTSTGSVSGAGNVTISGATVAFGGSYTVSGATIIDGGSGDFSTGQTVTLPTLTLSSGVLTGSDTVKVTGLTTWTGGLMGGSGTTDAVGGLALGQDNATLALDTRTLINESAAVFTGAGATLNVTSGAIINKLAGASWSVQTSNSQVSSTGGTFNNAGSVTIGSGAIFTIGTYTQTAGVTELDGGTLGDDTTILFQAGTVEGYGTLGGNVTNSGILSPGSSSTAGELSITGAYMQTACGILDAKIGGSTPGTNQDQLAVSGAAALNGTLTVSLLNGFQPNPGSAFQLVTFSSESNDFATRNGFNLGSGAAFVEGLNQPVGTWTVTATFPKPSRSRP
jgi:hypothetical protein